MSMTHVGALQLKLLNHATDNDKQEFGKSSDKWQSCYSSFVAQLSAETMS